MLEVPRLHEHKRTCEREERRPVRGLEKENRGIWEEGGT